MNRSAGLAVLLVGLALLGWGLHASDSLASAFSRLFNGAPTDKTIWLIVGGSLLSAAGIGALCLRPDRKAE